MTLKYCLMLSYASWGLCVALVSTMLIYEDFRNHRLENEGSEFVLGGAGK